jgi:hypothetical protein
MKTILARHRWLLFFLWLAVSAWGIALGAKLFELTVLIPAWAANPPQSLNLLPTDLAGQTILEISSNRSAPRYFSQLSALWLPVGKLGLPTRLCSGFRSAH